MFAGDFTVEARTCVVQYGKFSLHEVIITNSESVSGLS